MRNFRFQFTLRTVFIISFIFAIVCSILKCEMDACKNFENTVGIIRKLLAKVEPEVMHELYADWLKDAEINPTFMDFPYAHLKKDSWHVVCDRGGSGETSCDEYFVGSYRDWTIKRNILSPKIDFSHIPYGSHHVAVNITIQCKRPWCVISRKTTILIIIKPAAKNNLFMDPLKAELDKAGLSYEIKEN